MRYNDISGVILLGGKSSRYGRNKALVKINGVPLIERVISVMQSLFADVVLITNKPEVYAYLHLPMVRDIIKGLGPLGGIYTALKSIAGEGGFFVACDMPFLNPRLIRHMIDQREEYDVVVPRIGWKIETLHALYKKTCLPPIEKLIEECQYQVFRFFGQVSVRYIDEPEVREIDPLLRFLFNVNRPEDLNKEGI